MSFNDDEKDILGQSASSQEQFTRADHGRLEKLRDQIEYEHGRDVTEQQAVNRLNELKNNMGGEEDEETKRAQRDQDDEQNAKSPLASGTKTLKQEEQASVLGAQTKSTPEQVLDREKRKEEAQKELEQTDEMAQAG